jgi:hypothetical protein
MSQESMLAFLQQRRKRSFQTKELAVALAINYRTTNRNLRTLLAQHHVRCVLRRSRCTHRLHAHWQYTEGPSI